MASKPSARKPAPAKSSRPAELLGSPKGAKGKPAATPAATKPRAQAAPPTARGTRDAVDRISRSQGKLNADDLPPLDEMIKRAPVKPGENFAHKMARWHHDIAQVTGALSLRMTRQSIKKRELLALSGLLRDIAEQMEGYVNETTPG